MRINVTLDLDEAAVTALARLGRQHGRNFESTVQFLCCSAAAYSYAGQGAVETTLLLAGHAQRRLEPVEPDEEGSDAAP